jgi:hypothetical protein
LDDIVTAGVAANHARRPPASRRAPATHLKLMRQLDVSRNTVLAAWEQLPRFRAFL